MVAFLSQEWLDRQRELLADGPAHPGASAVVRCTVKDGRLERSWVTVIADGRPQSSVLTSEGSSPPDAEPPDFELLMSADDARRLADGSLALDVGFMQGTVKLVGDMGRFLSLLPLVHRPANRAACATLHAETQY